ncbi:MAG: DUF481 domain-containing protein [Bacteroidales bacterium]|nr:DUF481 domain-containing protein [Bacteroidales bacterium]
MKKIKIALIVLCFLCGNLNIATAQILNIEDERLQTDSVGWGGKMKLSLDYQKTDVDFYKSSIYAHTQYTNKKNLFLLLVDHNLSKGDGKEFANTTTQHFRYNRNLNSFLVGEVFVQGQFNKILNIRYRVLAGLGPRWEVYKSDKFKFYLGNIYMFENEVLTNGITEQAHRFSNYISFTLNLNEIVGLVHTSYYQPAIADFADFRIYSQSTLRVKITRRFSFSFDYKYYHDSKPPEGVINSTHNFLNGIDFIF